MTSEPLAPGVPAIILFRQVDRDDSRRPTVEANYFRIKILTEEGRKYANVEVPFLKGMQDVVDVGARTIRPDGSTVDFAGQVFDRELVKARGLKYLAKTFTLPDVQVGSIIEYFYTIRLGEYMLFDSHWILSNDLFTKKAQYSLKPSYMPYALRWSWHDLPPGANPKDGPDHVIRMEASNIPAFQIEDYMPPPNELKSRVDFIYRRGLGRERSGQFLEADREGAKRATRKVHWQAEGHGEGGGANRCAERYAGGETAKDL